MSNCSSADSTGSESPSSPESSELDIEIDLGDISKEEECEGEADKDDKLERKRGWSLPFVAPRHQQLPPRTREFGYPILTEQQRRGVAERDGTELCLPSFEPSGQTAAAEERGRDTGGAATLPHKAANPFPRNFKCPARLPVYCQPADAAALSKCTSRAALLGEQNGKQALSSESLRGAFSGTIPAAQQSEDFAGRMANEPTRSQEPYEMPDCAAAPTSGLCKLRDAVVSGHGVGESTLQHSTPALSGSTLATDASCSSKKRHARKIRPPLKKAYAEPYLEPAADDEATKNRDFSPESEPSNEIHQDHGQDAGKTENPFMSMRSKAKNEQFRLEMERRAERSQGHRTEPQQLGSFLHSFHREPAASGRNQPIDLTDEPSPPEPGGQFVAISDFSDDVLPIISERQPIATRPADRVQATGWQHNRPANAVRGRPGDNENWWLRFPDFVPISELSRGLNPRTGSVVYINYKAQFQEESLSAAPEGKKAAKTRGRKGKQADAGGKLQKAFFARKAFKRRR